MTVAPAAARLIFRTPWRGWEIVTYWPLSKGGGHATGSGGDCHQDDWLAGADLSVLAPAGRSGDARRPHDDGQAAHGAHRPDYRGADRESARAAPGAAQPTGGMGRDPGDRGRLRSARRRPPCR